MARDLELIPIDILLVTRYFFIIKNNGVMTLIIIGSNISGTSGRLPYISINFQALCGPWIVDGSTALRDVEAPGAGGKYFQPQHVSFGCPGDRKSCFYS